MDDGQLHDIAVLRSAVQSEVDQYIISGPTTSPEGARVAVALVLADLQEVIRSRPTPPHVDISVDEVAVRREG